MFPKQTVRSLEVAGKRVLVRVDFNVPLKDGRVADDTRIRDSLPTIEYLRAAGAKVILLSHLGRPEGTFDRSLTLDPVASSLAALLNEPVRKLDDCVGPHVREEVEKLYPGQVVLLENLRFYPGEEANDPGFARELADHGDYFVQDAFSVAHRAHASTVGVAGLLPAVAGLALEREYETVRSFLGSPRRPFWAVIGGAKVSTKIGVLRRLLALVDGLVIGGAMANTFLRAQGHTLGSSVYEPGSVGVASQLLASAAGIGKPVLLPVDGYVGLSPEATDARLARVEGIKTGEMLLDIGPESLKQFETALSGATQVVWNGPMGYAENPRFAQGTFKLASAVARPEIQSLVAGADTIAALENLGFGGRFSYISSGGGATLEFIEKGSLPGIEALRDKNQ
jgi:phosphoglycerate kinase